jgi:hypothetical protein
MLLTISILSLILLIWFRTEAWLDYCRLFDLDGISFYKDYEDKKYNDISLTYHIYLRRYHNGFFVRLITCPICLGVWLGVLACLWQIIIAICLSKLSGIGFTILIPVIVGIISQLPLLILGSLIIYVIINRLIG